MIMATWPNTQRATDMMHWCQRVALAAEPPVPEHMEVETTLEYLSWPGGNCQTERRPAVLPLPPAKRRRAAVWQSYWPSCEMLGTEIDVGELWVRMLRFEEHWRSHDLELCSGTALVLCLGKHARFELFAHQLSNLDRRVDQDSAKLEGAQRRLEAESARNEGFQSSIQATLSGLSERVDTGHQRLTDEIEAKCQEVGSELSKREAENQQALSSLSNRLQDVESHGEVAARGLRALEPFIERVTSRLEDVEQLQPVVDSMRSELSASSQVLRTAITAEGKLMEERLQTLREDICSSQESDRLRLVKDLQEVRNVAEAASEQAKELTNALAAGKEEDARALERLRQEAAANHRNLQAVEARLHDLRTGTAANLQGSEQRLEDMFRQELHSATDKAFAQDQAVSKKLEGELYVQIGAVTAEIKELKSVSMDSSEKLRVVEQEFSTLAEALERVKGQGISHEWKIPHCLRRLRYLSLLGEPGLWMDSERFYLGGLGPLEIRFYAKGLRGGDGQCSLALRLPSEAAVKLALPMMVDLSVAGRTLRAGQTTDPEGTDCITWLAESLGLLEDHLADEGADLLLAAELPLLAAPALLANTSCATLSPPSTRDDLCPSDITEEALGTDPTLAALSLGPMSAPRTRDSRGVPIRGNEAVQSAAALPTLLGQTEQPSGVFALRSSWGASCPLPVSKASNPFEEQFSPLGSLLGHGQRNPVAIPADDAAR
ncbi:unnamed protein product [Symbiodinium natans]|uniref:Uncharacterized protein n=1 Tax=Symbiodinium natans TaxID=878477 RepID=A0A812S838_9DINO|nr:unnamed protein product [Symbiodinium natans]